MRSNISVVLGAGLLLLPVLAPASGFRTTHQGGLGQSFALPALGEPRILDPGVRRSRWQVDLTNEYVAAENSRERLILDGERAQLAFSLREGMDGWEWGVELPLVHVGGGFLDGFIEGWHDAFGLPNAGREFAPRDRYLYRYERDGQVVLDRQEEGWALGDLRLETGWAWSSDLALRAQLKLPTGDEDRLAGGNLGAALWADAALPFAAGSRWSGFASVGLSANDRGDALADQQQRVLPFGGAGLFFRLTPALSLGSQLALQAPLYRNSELDALKRSSGELSFGGRWQRGDLRLDLAVQEDIVTESSPDFSIHVGLQLP